MWLCKGLTIKKINKSNAGYLGNNYVNKLLPSLSVLEGGELGELCFSGCCFVHSILLSRSWLFIQLLISGRHITAGDPENYKAPQDQPFQTAKKPQE